MLAIACYMTFSSIHFQITISCIHSLSEKDHEVTRKGERQSRISHALNIPEQP